MFFSVYTFIHLNVAINFEYYYSFSNVDLTTNILYSIIPYLIFALAVSYVDLEAAKAALLREHFQYIEKVVPRISSRLCI